MRTTLDRDAHSDDGLDFEKCAGARRQQLLPGAILLSEGETSGRLYILAEGSIEVLRGNTQVALIAGARRHFWRNVRAAASGRTRQP